MGKIPKNIKTQCVIYTLSDPDTKEIRYIGKTVKSLKHRLIDHLYSPKRETNYRTNWIKSILNKGKVPLIEEIETCTWDISQGKEIYWISQCKTWGFRLINLTEGGEGTLGIKFSKERRRKISESNSKIVYQYDLEGNFINEWYNATEAGKSIGKTNSKICACARGDRKTAYGYIWKYEKFDKIKPYIKPKHIVTEKNRLNLIKINSKPVLQYDLAMNFIKEWESAKVAAKELNLCRFSICNYLNGKRIEHKSKNKIGDFIWKRK